MDEGEADPENLARLNQIAAEEAERFDPCPSEAYSEFERDELVAKTGMLSWKEARKLPEHEYNFLLRIGIIRASAAHMEAESQQSETENATEGAEQRSSGMFG